MNIAITAGPTREFLDPVRFLSNASSGKMGYALAQVMSEHNHQVHLISGPVCLKPLKNCAMTFIQTAQDMLEAVMKMICHVDLFIMVAAVSDYTLKMSKEKLKKSKDNLCLHLSRTTDILLEVSKISHEAFVVGFSAETHNLLECSRMKLKKKRLDMIIANQVQMGCGVFGSDFNEGYILYANEDIADKKIERCSKRVFAQKIFQAICDEMH